MASIVGYTKAKVDQILTTGFVSLDSPVLTGNPTAPTPVAGDSDTSIATTAFVAASFAPIDSPTLTGDPKSPTPAAGDNGTSIATTAFVATSFSPIDSPVLTGNPTAPTPVAGDSDTSIATTAFVQGENLKLITTQTGTAYTLVLSDKGKVIESSNASNQSITVPPNSAVAFPIGTVIDLTWVGVGKPSFVPGVGVTINSMDNYTGVFKLWGNVTLRKRGTDLWILHGDIR